MHSPNNSIREKDGERDRVTGQMLILPESLEDGMVPGFAKYFCYICSFLIFGFIAWFSIAEIQELAITQGEVLPSSQIKKIHHLEGGLVFSVNADEGDFVHQGDVVISLSSVGSQVDLNQLKVRGDHLAIKKTRLLALISEVNPDFSKWEKTYSDITQNENRLFISARNKSKQELLNLKSIITQRSDELQSSILEQKSASRQALIALEKLKIKAKLKAKGYASKKSYLEAKAEYELAQAKTISATGKIAAAKQLLKQSHYNFTETQSETERKYSEELAKISSEIAELQETLSKHKDRVERLDIRAPVSGIIQELVPRFKGEVIKPGTLVFKVVPFDKKVIAEVKIKPSDIGHIKIGDIAKVNVTAYDTNVFGALEGIVKRVSASTFVTEKGDSYYKATIELQKNYIGHNQNKHFLMPGMQVQANIVTGAKSLFKYVFKPVYSSLDRAFSER